MHNECKNIIVVPRENNLAFIRLSEEEKMTSEQKNTCISIKLL